MWEIEYTNEFEEWWNTLNENEQEAVAYGVKMLEGAWPSLQFPYSSSIKSSKHGNMRELRSQCEGRPLRTFYAFDPRRVGAILIGGDKAGNDRFYEEFVPLADRIYDQYLQEIGSEK